MSKILDLSVFKEETFDIKMLDGKTLNIPKPSQKMVIEILKLREVTEESDAESIITAVNELTFEILNSNKNKVDVSREEVNEMDFNMKMAIIQSYTEFLTELQQNPNS